MEREHDYVQTSYAFQNSSSGTSAILNGALIYAAFSTKTSHAATFSAICFVAASSVTEATNTSISMAAFAERIKRSVSRSVDSVRPVSAMYFASACAYAIAVARPTPLPCVYQSLFIVM